MKFHDVKCIILIGLCTVHRYVGDRTEMNSSWFLYALPILSRLSLGLTKFTHRPYLANETYFHLYPVGSYVIALNNNECWPCPWVTLPVCCSRCISLAHFGLPALRLREVNCVWVFFFIVSNWNNCRSCDHTFLSAILTLEYCNIGRCWTWVCFWG